MSNLKIAELTLEVVSKVETLKLDEELVFQIHVKIAHQKNSLEAQGGGILAQVAVSEEEFNKIRVGDILWYEHTTTIHKDGEEE